jgi:microcompartment protein CcmL/EutN
MKMAAIGILETRGETGLIQGTDAMLKAADVQMSKSIGIGGGYVTVVVTGDVGSVKAAIDAGAEAASGIGELVAAHVIARPHDQLLDGF